MSEGAFNDCGCCAGVGAQTPALVYNRPGLQAIAYRIGNYATFRQSLLARLSDRRWPILRQLRTRDSDDFTIALLDAWALAGDVLTFYQERIASESYLRTATQRLSIVELARLIGYQLAPGLAASAHLAFTMEEAPGVLQQPATPLQLPIGTRVQSTPGPGQQPQTFETVEAIAARVEWNALLPQLTETQTLAWDIKELWLAGANLTLAVGDVLMIIADADGEKQASVRRVSQVSPDASANRTGVTLATISTTPQAVTALTTGVFAMRANAAPFGYNAPLKADYDTPANGGEAKFKGTFSEWSLDGAESVTQLTLSARNDKILADSWAVVEQFVFDSVRGATRRWIFSRVDRVTHLAVARYGLAGSATRLDFANEAWIKLGNSLTLLREMTVSAQSEELAAAALPVTYPLYGSTLALNSRVEGLVPGRPIAISGKRQRLRITHPAATFAHAGNVGREPRLLSGSPAIADRPDLLPKLILDEGGSVSLNPGDILALAAPPMKLVGAVPSALTPQEFGAAVGASSPAKLRLQVIDRDGKTGRVDISAGEIELLAGTDSDEPISEIVLIDDAPETAIGHARDRTTLQLATALANVYERASVRINANVAAATHGESVQEILGSGDAARGYQSFVLRQPPLTYVSADTPSGSASTLKIYVNDVLWQEAAFFYGRGASEHIYVLQRDDDGRTTVQFGDGINGARLPTGENNVRAEYRKGSGLGGLVAAGQINQLLSRPLGLKAVVNPQAAEGAADAEARDAARRNAPLTVLTLDRAVSLQDYEDFSRSFAGIAKAQAVWVWNGRKRAVFITVAGPDGSDLDESGAVVAQLKAALRAYGDPYIAFTVRNFRKALFQARGTVTVAADHVSDTVMAAVHAVLLERYSFAARAFGQPVAQSEAIATMQAVAGVVAVDIDQFYRNDTPTPASKARLDADRPAMGADGTVQAAELLLLDESALNQLGARQ